MPQTSPESQISAAASRLVIHFIRDLLPSLLLPVHVLLFTILCFLYPSFPTDNLKGHKGRGQQRSRETKQDKQTKLMKPANTMERTKQQKRRTISRHKGRTERQKRTVTRKESQEEGRMERKEEQSGKVRQYEKDGTN